MTQILPGNDAGTLTEASGKASLMEVRNLSVDYFIGHNRVVTGTSGVSLSVAAGEKVALVGESGSGKTTVASAMLALLPRNASVVSGQVELLGKDILTMPESEVLKLRGSQISRVPQDPLRSLNPVFSIGFQVAEAIRAHGTYKRNEIRSRVREVLHEVGIPDVDEKMRAYPHQLSGGMRQRVLIAMAIVNSPALLIADEPTTALDATIQAQIIALLEKVVSEKGMGLVLVTHNLGIVGGLCDSIAVMYRGEIVERGSAQSVLHAPEHPYTQMLMRASTEGQIARPVEGSKAILEKFNEVNRLEACRFLDRCPVSIAECATHPLLRETSNGRWVRCVHAPVQSIKDVQ
jgi:oligopeptide/dipeptide ABC transporter ATP-binding protein